jgi:hypothetical protein
MNSAALCGTRALRMYGLSMAKLPLFGNEPAGDMSYINVRAAQDNFMQSARSSCEELWELFEPYADPEFLIEIRNNFDARYWEMYLAAYLIKEGYEICAPKPGPDVGIRYRGCRIWFEATSPTRGAEGHPDQVPDIKYISQGEEPKFQEIPNERMLLRYLNSISEKQRQHALWLAAGVVAPEDSFVVAINPRGLRHEVADGDPPRILQAAYPVGSPYAALDPVTSNVVDTGYLFRDKIKKVLGAEVDTGVFLLRDYDGLSALLCSRVNVVNQPEKMGADFQLVENRRAKAPLPDMFRLKGEFFRIESIPDGYRAVRELHT